MSGLEIFLVIMVLFLALVVMCLGIWIAQLQNIIQILWRQEDKNTEWLQIIERDYGESFVDALARQDRGGRKKWELLIRP